MEWRPPGGVAAGDVMRCGGLCSIAALIETELSDGFWSACGAFDQQPGNNHEVVGEDRRTNKQRETLGAFGAATLHAATAQQHRDAPLDAGAKALALPERS